MIKRMNGFRIDLIGKYLSPHKKKILVGGISLLIVNILSVAIPMEVKKIIDELKEDFLISDLINQAAWIIALASLMGIMRLISRQLVFGVGRQVEVELRQKLFDHMISQEPSWINELGSGEIISRATSDIENIRRLLGFTVLSLTNTILAYSLTLPAMLSLDPWLTLSAISLYPIMLGIVGLFGGRMARQRRVQQEALSSLSELIQEDLSGISAIKIYGQENSEREAFSFKNKKYRDSAINLARSASTLFPLLQGISSISLLLLIALGSIQLEKGVLTIGSLVALILYVERLVFPTALLGFTLNTFQIGQVSLNRIEELLQRKPRIKNAGKTKSHKKEALGKLEARNLTITYQDSQREILKGIDFVINHGELISLVGPIGCGKTTLARAIGRMIEVPKGTLFLDDIDITLLPLENLRKLVSFVPQESYLFTSSLSENIKYGNPDASYLKVKEASIKAKLYDDIRGFPDGFETLVGERGITLSGGQRQRAALSRALLVSSPIILLDDALASVDNKTASGIIASIREETNRTIILISHQLSAAASCDRILVMDDGQIVQQGTHSQLINKDGTYKRLWERQEAKEKLDSLN